MSTLAERITAALRQLADASGDLDIRLGYGEPGHRIMIRGEVQDTGQAWETPGFLPMLVEAIADSGLPHEDSGTASAVFPTTVWELELSAVPYETVTMPCGYALSVFRNGVRMTYDPSLSLELSFDYVSATNRVRVYATATPAKITAFYSV